MCLVRNFESPACVLSAETRKPNSQVMPSALLQHPSLPMSTSPPPTGALSQRRRSSLSHTLASLLQLSSLTKAPPLLFKKDDVRAVRSRRGSFVSPEQERKAKTSYPMMVMRIATLLRLERLRPHQEMLKDGLMLPYNPGLMKGRIIFVSHQVRGPRYRADLFACCRARQVCYREGQVERGVSYAPCVCARGPEAHRLVYLGLQMISLAIPPFSPPYFPPISCPAPRPRPAPRPWPFSFSLPKSPVDWPRPCRRHRAPA